MKKALSGILFLAMLLSLVAVPAMAEEERPTLTVFVEAVATIEDFETNAATLWVEDKIGANLDFIVAPAGSAEEKMNVLLNGKNYPDIFYLKVPDEDLYGVETGILMDLTSLLPEMEYFNYNLNYYPIMGESMWASDGKLYAFPTYDGSLGHGNFPVKMLMNSDHMAELGLDFPTDLDEFHDALEAWVALDPENHIGLIGNTDNPPSDPLYWITNAFTYQPGNNWGYYLGLRTNNDVVETMFDDEEYREALRYIHQLYDEGLLYDASYTQNREQATALLASEGYPVLAWATTHNVRIVNASNTPDLYAATDFVAPIKGYNGEQYSTYIPNAVGSFMAISSTCEYPEIAAQFADLFYSAEGIAVINFGPIEHGHWRLPTEEEIALCKAANAPIPQYLRTDAFESGTQNFKWQPANPGIGGMADAENPHCRDLPVDYESLNYDDAVNGPAYRIYATTTQQLPLYQEVYETIPALKFTAAEKEEKATLEVSLESYLKQARIDFITGAKDLDADWDAYVAGIEELNMSRLVEIYQGVIDRNQK